MLTASNTAASARGNVPPPRQAFGMRAIVPRAPHAGHEDASCVRPWSRGDVHVSWASARSMTDIAPAQSRIGKYRLIGELGRGGMARVFLALTTGPAGFNKLVVIKEIHDQL